MKAIFTILSISAMLFAKAAAAADTMDFDCQLFARAAEQGAERFVKVRFLADDSAEMQIADLMSPFEKISQAHSLKRAHYSDSSSTAGAEWLDKNEKKLVSLNLAFFGAYWAGMLQFHQDANTPSLSFKKYEEIEIRCAEKKLPLESTSFSLN